MAEPSHTSPGVCPVPCPRPGEQGMGLGSGEWDWGGSGPGVWDWDRISAWGMRLGWVSAGEAVRPLSCTQKVKRTWTQWLMANKGAEVRIIPFGKVWTGTTTPAMGRDSSPAAVRAEDGVENRTFPTWTGWGTGASLSCSTSLRWILGLI